MVQPIAIIIAAIISSLLTLLGVFVTWGLNNITTESQQKRERDHKALERLEEKYLDALKTINGLLRNKRNDVTLNENLASAEASVNLIGNKSVNDKFDEMSDSYSSYIHAISDEDDNMPLPHYREKYNDFWDDLMVKKSELEKAMQDHLKSLDFYM